MHNLVQGENVMICCLENISRKRQAGFFLNQMNLQRRWFFLIWTLSCLAFPGFLWQIKGAPHLSLSPLSNLTQWVKFASGSSVLSHENQALSSCPLIELTPLRCSVYMPASLSQRTIEVRGVAIVYPQVSLTILLTDHFTSTHFTDSPPYPPCNVNMSFSFWPWYLLMYFEQSYLCSGF